MWFYLQIRESYCCYCLGVVSHYFLPRWRLFLNALNTSLVTGIPFNQTHTAKRIFREVEKVFTLDTTVFPTIPQGNKAQSDLSSQMPRIMNNSVYEQIFQTQSVSDDVLCLELRNTQAVPRDRKKKKNPLPNNNMSLPHHLPLTPSTLLHTGTGKLY